MDCRICSQASKPIFKTEVLKKYQIQYYQCPNCGYVQTETPYWLDEAYASPINFGDTGLADRNLRQLRQTSCLLYYFFNRNGKFLDYAGGYGLFTRLMRDVGFNFYNYEPYTQNLLARGFAGSPSDGPFELVTAFEAFEHFDKPIQSIEEMFAASPNVFFSTVMVSEPAPKEGTWWYYGHKHGQHVGIFTTRSLSMLGAKYGRNYYNFGSFHLFTTKKINSFWFKVVMKLAKYNLTDWVRRNMQSRVQSDFQDLLKLADTNPEVLK